MTGLSLSRLSPPLAALYASHGASNRENNDPHDPRGPDPREACVQVAETDRTDGKAAETGNGVAALVISVL